MSARRLLWRWAWRVAGRDRGQLSRIVVTVAAAVALAVAAVVSTYNLVEPPTADYGAGSVRAVIAGDGAAAASGLEETVGSFGTVRSGSVDVPGSARPVTVRAQDPDDALAAPLLDLVEGSYPRGAGEVAVTDAIAERFSVAIGDRLRVGSGSYAVVGLVENPTDLDDEFVLAAELDAHGIVPADTVTTFLVAAPAAEVEAGIDGPVTIEHPGTGVPDTRTVATVAMSVVITVVLAQVALLSSSGFAALARRRTRQFGLLATIGASPRHLRFAAAAIGTVAGGLGAAIGVAVGLASSTPLVPRLEELVGHRIDLAVPWWAIATCVATAVGTSTAAAWWPARAVARRPVVEVLAATRPVARSVTGTTWSAVGSFTLGAVGLLAGVSGRNGALAICGVIGVLAGVVLLSPLAVRWCGRLGAVERGAPLPARIGARAVARSHGSSAALLGALVVTLGVPLAVAAGSAAIDAGNGASPANLPEGIALVRLDETTDGEAMIPRDADAEIARAVAGTLQATISAARLIPIEVAVDANATVFAGSFTVAGDVPAVYPEVVLRRLDEPCQECNLFGFGETDADGAPIEYRGLDTWIADDELFGVLGLPRDLARRANTIVTAGDDDVLSADHQARGGEHRVAPFDPGEMPDFSSVAAAFVDRDTAAQLDLSTRLVGWLVVADDGTLDDDDRATIAAAVGDDALVEFVEPPRSSIGLQAAAMAIALVFALGALWMTIGLLRLESAPDVRLLGLIGASDRTRRLVVAASVGLLALGAGLLTMPIGVLTELAMVVDDGSEHRFAVPWTATAVVLVVVPTVTAALAAARRPDATRPVLS